MKKPPSGAEFGQLRPSAVQADLLLVREKKMGHQRRVSRKRPFGRCLRTSGAAMCGPVGEKQAAGDGAGLRPFGGKCVGAGGSAGNSRMAGDDQQVLRRVAMCR